MNTRSIGIKGEDIAVKYLSKHGYKILERNYKTSHGEIDIVAKQGSFYVFIEVKRRKTEKFGLPREAVTPQKKKTIADCAKRWMFEKKLYGLPMRFDVVEVFEETPTLLQDAFRAE